MRMMMMGGVPIEYDERLDTPDRKDTFNNPYGFFEIGKPTYTKCYKAWLPSMTENAPANSKYIYIKRNLDDVYASWDRAHAKMEQQRIKHEPNYKPNKENREKARDLRNNRIKEVRQTWLNLLRSKTVLMLDYEEVIKNPTLAAQRIAGFVGGSFDVAQAAQAVDIELANKE
jgi:hypothetical protein